MDAMKTNHGSRSNCRVSNAQARGIAASDSGNETNLLGSDIDLAAFLDAEIWRKKLPHEVLTAFYFGCIGFDSSMAAGHVAGTHV